MTNLWYWDDVDVDPEHLRMGVTKDGQGPVEEGEADFDHYECWCGETGCTKYEENMVGPIPDVSGDLVDLTEDSNHPSWWYRMKFKLWMLWQIIFLGRT